MASIERFGQSRAPEGDLSGYQPVEPMRLPELGRVFFELTGPPLGRDQFDEIAGSAVA